jgi:hypothetical protein
VKLRPIDSACRSLVTSARKSDFLWRVSESANQPPTDIAELQAQLAAALVDRDAAIAARDKALS